MKFKIKKSEVGNHQVFLRRSGYALIFDRHRGVESFVRRLGSGYYPRLHLYIDDMGDSFLFNLHLDQKKASYQDHNMHNAEYDNDIISEEANRLRGLTVNQDNDREIIDDTNEKRVSHKISYGNLEKDLLRMKANKEKKKKRFWIF